MSYAPASPTANGNGNYGSYAQAPSSPRAPPSPRGPPYHGPVVSAPASPRLTIGGTNTALPAELANFADCIAPVSAGISYRKIIKPTIRHIREFTEETVAIPVPASATVLPTQDLGTTDICATCAPPVAVAVAPSCGCGPAAAVVAPGVGRPYGYGYY